ncbi:MAG: metallophosphoesterase family protein [Rikenellaceae bacterium]
MKSITIPETIESLYICGDIHGDFRTLIYNIKRLNIENAAIIVAGDCGFGFEKEDHYKNLYNGLSRTLAKLNIFVLMIRGNHDDPAYFNGHRINYKRFKCVADYSVVVFNENNILCIGGGISIDRTMRKMDMEYYKVVKGRDITSYWEDENVVYNPEVISQLPPINAVVTHSAPSICFPTSKKGIEDWFRADSELEADLDKERSRLDKILHDLRQGNHPLTDWYYGHFHASKAETIDKINYHLLDIMEFKEVR